MASLGEGHEPEAVNQMANACSLPVALAGALMPDAHYSKRALARHTDLPNEQKHLAWLSLEEEEGKGILGSHGSDGALRCR